MKHLFWILLLCLAACSGPSAEQLRKRGEAEARLLTEQLQKVHTVEELKAAKPLLRKRFNRMAELVLQARQYREKHPGEEPMPPHRGCDELFAELARLYELPGGWELIHLSQEEALEIISQ